MKIRVLTLFTDIFKIYLSQTIMQRANDQNIKIDIENIRDYSDNKHKQVDDTPFGGGAGMVLKPEPFWKYFVNLRKSKIKKPFTIFVTPQGKKLTQEKLIELSKMEDLCIISGKYEGLDQRVIDKFVDEEISIGDYVLSSGDLPSLVIIDGIMRMKDGIIKKESYETDSFYNGLLGFPQYTRPQMIDKMEVPEVLISGNHEKINQYREMKAIFKTLKNRPDLLEEKFKDKDFLRKYDEFLKLIETL
ncbi:tRNA (guanosine(37)-N1)-methyltransferase TrmD [Streptobacillus moniliformis]|uniref:tRNA (guanine-N(1)-)-methyltransferase n=1 Tax=Streptobacillus moniliformis (strain ATCC 14647 / DSM 12112 / NCTC 10651 / 9901) TaxID=519441 RepID=D1AYD9_STRM9|nr:tRNA (guanosine(37)-N1)-methyltransferase TrmD [Streptobacillus moniliformis]ACZ01315.1 tRNA (guanine-N1)-methyltransferase [Streptobacillus moniliformis DSM 12112]AVL43663.1 tRNA (guanosine(37)-N1)-methyltransferase TrmD [Streptobacillus moniliformis]SQA13527.1 tRNA (guanine-N(1)-)-methyltransferase [Streptobacillus moniliformis]